MLLFRRAAREVAASAGLSVDEMHSVMLLQAGKIPNVKSLGESLGLNVTRISKILRSLEEKGYVSRQMSHSDRRVEEVSLTDKGIKAAEDMFSFDREMIQKYLCQLPSYESTLLSQLILGND